MQPKPAPGKRRPRLAIQIEPVWNQITPELTAELRAFWRENNAIGDPQMANERAQQAICVARAATGKICGVSTAVLCVLPRLLQPMYYYRTFLAKTARGQGLVTAMHNQSHEILQTYNQALATPESLGVLVELESPFLSALYKHAYTPETNTIFIGYSPRGFQLRVCYFKGAILLPPTKGT